MPLATELALVSGAGMSRRRQDRRPAFPTLGSSALDLAGADRGLLENVWSGRTAAAAARRDYLLRLLRRSELAGRMIAFCEELLLSQSEDAVCEVVARHAGEMVGVYTTAVLLREEGPVSAEGEVRVAATWAATAGGRALEMSLERLPSEAGLVAGSDLWSESRAAGELALVAHVPIGGRGVLLLTERRSDRIFDEEDWSVLDVVVEQGRVALERVREMEVAQAQALHDPLTGLANRRKMEVVMEQAWAAAERGEGLTLLMMDLDGFKGVNDRLGHAAGDDILRIVGESLRQEVRRSDTAVRYGGDEFLVILPHAGVAGARLLAERVRRRTAGWVNISMGIAEYSPLHATPAHLLAAADAAMYAARGAGLGIRDSGDDGGAGIGIRGPGDADANSGEVVV